MIKVYALILIGLLSSTAHEAVARTSDRDRDNAVVSQDQDAQCEQPRESYIEVENTRLRYVEAGSGPAVVMIHGNAGSAEEFDFKRLGPLCRDHKVIAIDRPGHGKSQRPDGLDATLSYQTQLIREAILHLGITRPVLVGHSWGGSLALAYAVEYPKELSAIVLLAPAAYPDGGSDQFMRAIVKTPLIGDVSLTVGRIIFGKHMLKKELERAFYPDAVPDEYLRQASSSWLHHKQLRAYVEDEYGLDKDLNKLSKQYSKISIPVVVVTGDHDKVVPPKQNAYRLKSSVAQCKVIELKNTGHQVTQTHPESIYNAVTLISTSSTEQPSSSHSY